MSADAKRGAVILTVQPEGDPPPWWPQTEQMVLPVTLDPRFPGSWRVGVQADLAIVGTSKRGRIRKKQVQRAIDALIDDWLESYDDSDWIFSLWPPIPVDTRYMITVPMGMP